MGPNSYKIHSVSKTKTNQFMKFRKINAVYSHNEIIPVHTVWVKSNFLGLMFMDPGIVIIF